MDRRMFLQSLPAMVAGIMSINHLNDLEARRRKRLNELIFEQLSAMDQQTIQAVSDYIRCRIREGRKTT